LRYLDVDELSSSKGSIPLKWNYESFRKVSSSIISSLLELKLLID
jgi:hypothetical protein